MDRTRKFLIGIIILLAGTAGWEGYVLATPAPSQNLTCEPGGCNGPQACTDNIWLDGTTPIDTRVRNPQVTGTAGQELGAFVTSIIANSQQICFSGQAFSQSTSILPVKNVALLGQIGQTKITWTGGNNNNGFIDLVNSAGSAVASNVTISGITFDAKSNMPWITSQRQNSSPASAQDLVSNITIEHNTFLNAGANGITLFASGFYIAFNTFGSSTQGDVFVGGGAGAVAYNEFTSTSGDDAIAVTEFPNTNCCSAGSYIGPHDISVVGNNIHDRSTGNGIDILSGQRITVTGNNIKQVKNGGIVVSTLGAVPVVGAANFVSQISITGNTIQDPGFGGTGGVACITLSATSTASKLAKDGTIAGNVCTITSADTNANVQGILVQGYSGVAVTGNSVDNVPTNGIWIQGLGTPQFARNETVVGNVVTFTAIGIQIDAEGDPLTADKSIFSSNSVNDATGINIKIISGNIGSFLLVNNPGYNPQPVSGLMTAGASPFTVPAQSYNYIFILTSPNGISALTLDTINVSISGNIPLFVGQGHTVVITWATTAPIFREDPQ